MDAQRAQRMIRIEDPTPRATSPSGSFALWNLGFRPFYMLASIFAASSILLWIWQYTAPWPATYLRSPPGTGTVLFGYAGGHRGFLLTAVAN
jgi:uncharacterized protein involved in response to NO